MQGVGRIRLLEAAPALAEGLAPEDRVSASAALQVPVVSAEEGPFHADGLRALPGVSGPVIGVVVLQGTMTVTVEIAGRRCMRLHGPGELLLTDGADADSVPMRWSQEVKGGARLAVLDDVFLRAARRWPRLLNRVFARVGAQAQDSMVQQAISQLPRVEDRLLACLWVLADRHGRMTAEGAALDAVVTHQELGSMIGAARPTVSLGLVKLVEAGLVRVEEGRWLIAPSSLARLA